MRLSSVRIIWITLFSIFTLLSTSVASSEPLMTFKMLTSMNMTHESVPSCHSKVQASHSKHQDHQSKNIKLSALDHPIESSSAHCDTSPESMHNCCSAACVNAMALIPGADKLVHFDAQLVLIEAISQEIFALPPKSLYRPPIA